MTTVNKLNQISSLAIKIQEMGLGSVNVWYSGHVDQINVMIYPQGAKNFDVCIQKSFYCDQPNSDLKCLEMINYLQTCIINNEIKP
jgi:hypothetical protein